HTVSGTISRPLTGALFTFPSRYLFAIGHQVVFRLRRWSSRIHTGFHGPRATWDTARESLRFRLRGYHPLCRRFPAPSATQAISPPPPDQQLRPDGPATPDTQRLPAMTRARFGLIPFRSPLLRESRLLSLPAGTEMFHFPAFPPPALCVQAGATGHYARSGFPIRTSPDRRLVADSQGLSQAPTSFLGSWYQGIHRVPLLTWQLQMMLASTVQFSRTGRPRPPPPSRAPGGTVLAEDSPTAVPSGPNSVPAPRPAPGRRSAPGTASRTGRTSRPG